MKHILFVLLLFFCGHLSAQMPVIDHLEVDEAMNQLKIWGTFHSASGEVTIEDTLLHTLSWTDSLIISELPIIGRGSAGAVLVKDIQGTSLKRTLSLFKISISNPTFYFILNPIKTFLRTEDRIWNLDWRSDISSRSNFEDSIILFEVSRSSSGFRNFELGLSIGLHWADTTNLTDSSVSLKGKINLRQGMIIFDTAKILSPVPVQYSGQGKLVLYLPLSISFDSTGYVSGYIDSGTIGGGISYTHWDNRLGSQQLLFPPYPKSSVRFSDKNEKKFAVAFDGQGNSPSIHLMLREAVNVNASFYDILGRKIQTLHNGYLNEGEHNFELQTHSANTPLFLEMLIDNKRYVEKLPLMLK